MPCSKCGNEHPGHDCTKFVNRLKLDNAGVAYKVGVPHGCTICEAIWYPCDRTCVWPDVCKGHIECQCVDHHGKEFYRLLTMNNSSSLMWETKMRIYKIDGEITRVNRVDSRRPALMAEECEKKGLPLTEEAWNQDHIRELISCPECGSPIACERSCMTCYSCGWSACG